MSTFTLNKQIFNQALYKKVQELWFEGFPLGSEPSMDVAKRWFMLKGDERDAFDSICRNAFLPALESIGPEAFPNSNAEPFLTVVQEIASQNGKDDKFEAAWTALSIVLLLDQMPRNIFRTKEGLRKVYTHYDKISYSFVDRLLSEDSPFSRPDLQPSFRTSVGHRFWFYLPLMHSEAVDAHNKFDDLMAGMKDDLLQESPNEKKMIFLEQGITSEKEHREILDRFGRYPHRNGALGRESTQEEREFLAGGGGTFGVSQE